MSQVIQLVPAHPGWVSVFSSDDGHRTYRPIVAFGLVEDDDGARSLQPYSGDAHTDDLIDGFMGYEYSPHTVQELERAAGRAGREKR